MKRVIRNKSVSHETVTIASDDQGDVRITCDAGVLSLTENEFLKIFDSSSFLVDWDAPAPVPFITK